MDRNEWVGMGLFALIGGAIGFVVLRRINGVRSTLPVTRSRQ
jgi:hypothetical protein